MKHLSCYISLLYFCKLNCPSLTISPRYSSIFCILYSFFVKLSFFTFPQQFVVHFIESSLYYPTTLATYVVNTSKLSCRIGGFPLFHLCFSYLSYFSRCNLERSGETRGRQRQARGGNCSSSRCSCSFSFSFSFFFSSGSHSWRPLISGITICVLHIHIIWPEGNYLYSLSLSFSLSLSLSLSAATWPVGLHLF